MFRFPIRFWTPDHSIEDYLSLDSQLYKWVYGVEVANINREEILNKLKNEFNGAIQDRESLIELESQSKKIIPQSVIEDTMAIFVPPLNFADSVRKLKEKKLVFVEGPAGVGKSTFALMLLKSIQTKNPMNALELHVPEPTIESLEKLEGNKNVLVLFDSPFGDRDKYEPIDRRFASRFESLLKIKKSNWIVCTTRREPLMVASRNIEERNLSDYFIFLHQDSYDDEILTEIVKRHMSSRKAQEKVNNEAYEFVSSKEKLRLIVGNLRFPHNIKRFVWDNLDSVNNSEENLKLAIDKSKKTKEVAKLYFESLSGNQELLILTVAMFNDLLNDFDFFQVLKKVFEVNNLELSILNYTKLKKDVRFIRKWGKVAFEHKDYHDGIVEALIPKDDDNIETLISKDYNAIITQFSSVIEQFTRHDKVDIRRSLWFPLIQIAKVNPELALPHVKMLLNDSDKIVKNSALAPLKKLMSLESFGTLVMKFKDEFHFNEDQERDPNLHNIIYRKMLKKYIIRPYIDDFNVTGLMGFVDKFNDHFKLFIFIIRELIEVYEKDPVHAIEFYKSWYHLDPINAPRRIQDSMWRNISDKHINFIIEAMGAIPFDCAINEVIKWSLTRTSNQKVINRHIRVISACLKAFYKDHKKEISSLMIEWTHPENKNSIQNSVAMSW